MNFKSLACCCFLLLVVQTHVHPASAQPLIVEPGWTLIRSIEFDNPVAASHNALDERLYVGRRVTSSDGLYRIDFYGFSVMLTSASDVAAVAVQPDSGHVFFSEDYGGRIYRIEFGGSGRETWVSGFRSGDDDPVGMAFAPGDYAGSVLQPGEALVVDRGNGGYDDVFWWSPLAPEGEYLVHPDDGTLVDAVDVTIDQDEVYVVDSGLSADGAIYVLHPDSTLTQLTTSELIANPLGIVTDPSTGDLLVLDSEPGRLVRVDPLTGQVSDIVTNLAGPMWAGVDVTADGRQIIISDYAADEIHVFARCDAIGQPDIDCDGNGVYDLCDIVAQTYEDCNHNGVPDQCDLDSGSSDDCNEDGRPDDCPICPPVEVVFIMDTSSSMDSEAASLCSSMEHIVDFLLAVDVDAEATLLGICDTPGGAYGCLTDNVTNLLGTEVPGTPPPGLETLGDCPGGNQVCKEDWGLATAVVAGMYTWMPDSTSIRLIVPLSDEGAWCGDPVNDLDHDAITHAITIAQENMVIVSPITGSGSSSAVVAQAEQIADATGGSHFSSSDATDEIAYAIVELVLAACAAYTDCNENGVLDECDIADGTSADVNLNGIPDECETTAVIEAGRTPRITSLFQNHPNPFNPRTTILFDLPLRSTVRLAVYDLVGRMVAVLFDEVDVSAGTHSATWTGTDSHGRAMPSGTYFYKLEASGLVDTRRMVLIR